MRAFPRIAAAFSFLFCFLTGVCLLRPALSAPREDSFILVAVGLFFVGLAFFFGSILWLVGERSRKILDGLEHFGEARRPLSP